MKRKFKRLLVAIMSLAILLSGMLGTKINIASAADDAIKLTSSDEFDLKPGESSTIRLKLLASEYIYNPKITISSDDDAPFTFTKPKLFIEDLEVSNISSNVKTDFVFDVSVKDTAKIKTYPVKIVFTYENYSSDFVLTKYTTTINLKFKISEEKVPAQLTVNNVYLSSNSKGSDTEIVFFVKNEGETLAKNAYLTMDFGDSIEERYTVKNIKLGDMKQGDVQDVKLPISILSSAATGRYKIAANFTYKTSDGLDEIKSTYEFFINIADADEEAKVPKLIITDLDYMENLKPGDEFELNVSLKNNGGAAAKNVTAAIDASSISETGIIKNYLMDSIAVDDIKKDATVSVKLPLKVAKGSKGGLLPVKLVFTYMDNDDESYSFNETVYIDVVSVETDTEKPNLVISNVTQNPAKPVAGGKVEVSFDLENKGKVDAEKVMVSVDGYSESTFIPVNSDPYLYFDSIKAKDKVKVTIPLFVSSKISAGLNNITVKISDIDNISSSVNIPIKDVQNDAAGISKPVLMIANYETDVDELKAGGTFNLTFEIYNTNATTAAKNIKVTIKKPTDINSDVFTLTQGNNSFFINRLNPEEGKTINVPMKVKTIAATQVYPVVVQIEYEYDGLKPDPDTGDVKAITMTEDLNLQVIENARPVVDNVSIYSWDGPVIIGNPASLHLEFYNMGRSTLNNVTMFIEGDFTKTDGSMYFAGNIQSGGNTYADFDVTPNVVGPAKCIIRVTYEDSNGDVHEFTHEYTTEVMEAGSNEFFPDMGGLPEGGEVFNPGGITTKKNIVPLWAFILIQCAIFIIFVPVTRKIILSVYKARLLKKEQEKY